MPVRCGFAHYRDRGAHRCRCIARERHDHLAAITACHQSQPCRGATQRRRKHRRGHQVGAVVVARCVAAVQGERAAVAVDGQAFGMHVAVADIDAAGGVADIDQRPLRIADLEAIDDQLVGLDGQRHFDVRQHVRPARQLERLVIAGQAERGVVDFQHIQLQAAAQQWAQVRIQEHAFSGEVDIAMAEIHATQGQRSGQRAVHFLPCQR